MFSSARISLPTLAALCRRLATQLAAGVDVRRAWLREAENAQAGERRAFTMVSDGVARGRTMTESLKSTGQFFPTLFLELVEVGEQSGRLAEVLRQLSGHYEHLIQLRRNFRSAISWPVIQLGLALAIVGLLIWVMGILPQEHGKPIIDLLGLGLYGNQGLVVYVSFLIAVASCAFFLYRGVRRGLLWTRPLQLVLMRVPKLGTALETLALSRLAWSLFVTFESGMELRRALALSLRSTHNWRYTSQIEPIWLSIRSGRELYEAMAATQVFPRSFLDAIEVGERSGRLAETLEVLSEQYQQEARSALGVLTMLAGFLVWCLVAMLIIAVILQIAQQHVNVINNAANGKF